jgi:general secretion pathway protein A
MYQEFYGLREKPFNLTPDPQFLYLSESHRTALDSLLYGIKERAGFMVLTGDIGTGKTTICRALLKKLGGQVRTAVIFNPFVSEGELLKSILQDFGLPSLGRSKKDRMDALNRFLIEILSRSETAVLIIDEAQNLSIPALEQVRMLSNLETEKEKMLQIILIGQLELGPKLQSPELKQLNQRVAIRSRLMPLSQSETVGYIHQRLMVAGAQGRIHWARSALNEIYKFSGGVPRLINLLCDRTLMASFVAQTYHINKKIVQKARASILGKEEGMATTHSWSRFRRPIPLCMGISLVLISLWAAILLSDLPAKNSWKGKIQGLYLKFSHALENSASKIQVQGSFLESRKVPPKGGFQ